MRFSAGQILVHPHHGPTSVMTVTNRTFRGREMPYLLLRVQATDLIVGIPLENVELVGLREVFGGEQLEELMSVLRAPTGPEEPQWSRRMKDHEEKLASGDLLQTAEVVRDLIRRHEAHTLSRTETILLRRSSRPLITELRLALDLTPEDAAEYLDSLCRNGALPVRRAPAAGQPVAVH